MFKKNMASDKLSAMASDGGAAINHSWPQWAKIRKKVPFMDASLFASKTKGLRFEENFSRNVDFSI